MLPASSFQKRSSSKDGLQTYCWPCQKTKARERWNSLPEWKRRDTNLRNRYKISEAEYVERFDAQNGRCSICDQERKLVVDHCHDTGDVRGLICGDCNKGIGFLGDGRDLEIFKNAIEYLK